MAYPTVNASDPAGHSAGPLSKVGRPGFHRENEEETVSELKYSKYLFTGLKDDMPSAVDYVASPSAYFRGAHQIPNLSGGHEEWV